MRNTMLAVKSGSRCRRLCVNVNFRFGSRTINSNFISGYSIRFLPLPSMMNDAEDESREKGIMDLPEEILEYILSLLSPYSDFQSARLVCRLWYKIMLGVVQQTHTAFVQAMSEGDVRWIGLQPESGATITDRYSHSACYHSKSIYVFGGCTSTATTFNDLWRLDLASRQWVRPLAIGAYPSPKACASLVSYKDSLILFGGWSHPTPLPLHQPNNYFNELHMYTPALSTWSAIPEEPARAGVPGAPAGRAGHAASVVGDKMVVFGGSMAHSTRCDDVWVLDLESLKWSLIDVQGVKPRPRFGHAQTVLDSDHLLVIGGCAGPNMQYNDVWLLKMTSMARWFWQEIKVTGQEHSPPKLWCQPPCKVGDNVIVLSQLSSRSPRLASLESNDLPKALPDSPAKACRPSHLENGRKTLPKRRLPETSESSSQESSSDGEERSAYVRKPCSGSAYYASRMASQLGADGPFGNKGSNSRCQGHPSQDSSPARDGQDDNLNDRGQRMNVSEPVAGPSGISTSRDELGANVSYGGGLSGAAGASVQPHTLPLRDGMPSIRPNAMKNRQKQLEALLRYEERIRSKLRQPLPAGISAPGGASIRQPDEVRPQAAPSISGVVIRDPMFLHALDISRAISDEEVRWREVGNDFIGLPPEEKILYSLVAGRGELVMFGGIHTDVNTMQRGLHTSRYQWATNQTHFIQAKPKVR